MQDSKGELGDTCRGGYFKPYLIFHQDIKLLIYRYKASVYTYSTSSVKYELLT